MRGRMIHDKSGDLHFAPYDRRSKKMHQLDRARRAQHHRDRSRAALSERARPFQSSLHRCRSDPNRSPILETGNAAQVDCQAHGDAVIGVDGAFSAVRQSMQKKLENFEYDESYLPHGYKELTIPPGPDGSWRMEKNALHIWPRKSFMMIALPNPDGSFTCTLFWEFEGPRSFATTKTDDEVCRFFEKNFPTPFRSCRLCSKILGKIRPARS